jgi:hypothetical protein
MRAFVFLTRLALGAISLTAFATAPRPFAFAFEDQQHEIINGVVQKVDDSAGNITLKHGPRRRDTHTNHQERSDKRRRLSQPWQRASDARRDLIRLKRLHNRAKACARHG